MHISLYGAKSTNLVQVARPPPPVRVVCPTFLCCPPLRLCAPSGAVEAPAPLMYFLLPSLSPCLPGCACAFPGSCLGVTYSLSW
jgi:hypothetical protein